MSSGGAVRHGTRAAYDHGKCRCDPCRAAKAASQAAYRAAKGTLAPNDPRHGTHNGYANYGCRCPECLTAETAYTAGLRARRREASGNTKTPLTGPRAVGSLEHAALTRLHTRYQTRAGHLHRTMLERMLFYSAIWHHKAVVRPIGDIARGVHEALVEQYGDLTPSPDGYSQDVTDLLSVEKFRTARNIDFALDTALFVPSTATIPLMREIAADLSSPRGWSVSRHRENLLTFGYTLAEHPGIHANSSLLHAYFDTDPAFGWDEFVIESSARAGASWDGELVSRFLTRYDTAIVHVPGIVVDPRSGVASWEDTHVIETALASLLAQPNAPADRVTASLDQLVAYFERVVNVTPDSREYDSDPAEAGRVNLSRVLDPAHQLRSQLPPELISRALIAFALN